MFKCKSLCQISESRDAIRQLSERRQAGLPAILEEEEDEAGLPAILQEEEGEAALPEDDHNCEYGGGDHHDAEADNETAVAEPMQREEPELLGPVAKSLLRDMTDRCFIVNTQKCDSSKEPPWDIRRVWVGGGGGVQTAKCRYFTVILIL